ncbi:MAG: secretin and TonB N-terminal domain-containing protein, partial [Pseudomonas sp.]|nr:secretin and TonB N-terminal domain-containing protein [Pseudomonas sp.]
MLGLQATQAETFQGEPMSLNLQDVELRSVLQVMADHAGVNLVVGDSVQGRITLRLEDVPWEQALDLVLRSKGLGRRREGNVLLVAPVAELAGQVQGIEPLQRELIPVFHAKAGELAELLLASLADDGALAGRGSLSVDARTNTLVATHEFRAVGIDVNRKKTEEYHEIEDRAIPDALDRGLPPENLPGRPSARGDRQGPQPAQDAPVQVRPQDEQGNQPSQPVNAFPAGFIIAQPSEHDSQEEDGGDQRPDV